MFTTKWKSTSNFLIFQYIFFCTVLPSGYIYDIPVKMISISIFFVFFLTKTLMKEKISLTVHHKIYALAHVFLLISIPISIFNGYEIEFIFKELVLITSFSIPVLLIFILIHNCLLDRKEIGRVVIFSGFCFSLWKTILFFGVFVGYWNYNSDIKYFFEVTQYEPVGLNIIGGFSRFSYVVLDLTALMIYFFWLINKREFRLDNLLFSAFYSLLMFFVIFSAYSRFIFIYSVILFLLYSLMYNKKLFLLYVLFSLICSIYFFDEILQVVSQRFIGQEHSDVHRVDMINNLLTFFSQSPIFGWGIGSYIHNYVRDSSLPFSYEVQFLLLLAQFGISFLLFIFYVFMDYLRFFIVSNRNKKNIFFGLVFFVFYMASSFTNQYLTSSSSLSLILVIALLRCSEKSVINCRRTGLNNDLL